MAAYNRVILIGNLTRDVELKQIPSGTSVAEIGLAITERRKGQGGQQTEETTFVDVTLWGRTAEIVQQYTVKGDPLMVEGKLKFDQWQDPQGQRRSKLRVVGQTVQLLAHRPFGTKGIGEGNSYSRGTKGQHEPPRNNRLQTRDSYEGDHVPNYDEEVPF